MQKQDTEDVIHKTLSQKCGTLKSLIDPKALANKWSNLISYHRTGTKMFGLKCDTYTLKSLINPKV